MKNKFGFILVKPQLGENIGACARSMKNFGFKKGDFPVSENFYRQQVSIPIYPNLIEEDQNKFIQLTKDLIK